MTEIIETLNRNLASRYRLERPVGTGGMGAVFVAHDLKHGRSVAIKVLRGEVAYELGVERFLREIETAARLTRPYILPLYDSGEAEGLLYYVMPFAGGESLRDRLDREGPIALPDALNIATGWRR